MTLVSRVVVIFQESKYLHRKVNSERLVIGFSATQVCNTAFLCGVLLAFSSDLSSTILGSKNL